MSKYMAASSIVTNLEGLRRDMRANAFEYLARAEDLAKDPQQVYAEAVASIPVGDLAGMTDEQVDSWGKAAVARLNTLSTISQVIAGNAQGYMMRLKGWYQADRADPSITALMQAGIELDPSMSLSGMDSFAEKLLAVANAEASATITTADDIMALSKATLTALPFVPS